MFIKLYLEEKNNFFNFMNCTFDVITKKSLQSLIFQRFLPIIFFKKSYSINFSIWVYDSFGVHFYTWYEV